MEDGPGIAPSPTDMEVALLVLVRTRTDYGRRHVILKGTYGEWLEHEQPVTRYGLTDSVWMVPTWQPPTPEPEE